MSNGIDMNIPPITVIITRAIALAFIPKAIETIEDTFKKLINEWFDENEPVKTIKYRKPPDTTKMTQFMFDKIMSIRNQWVYHNTNFPKDKRTQNDLTRVINEQLGLNKSRTTLARVWNGKLNREDLPKGKPRNT